MARRPGGRTRGRVGSIKGTAAAAVAMATLTASQAPGLTARTADPGERVAPPPGPAVSDSPYRTELPPLPTSTPEEGSPSAVVAERYGAVPATVLDAYRRAERRLADEQPQCRLPWQLLAAIGQVESGQARGGRLTADGTAVPPIRGPRLDGDGFALIRDTDGGAHDGDAVYDRAVGPMQFIPSTWASWGADGNGDGVADPDNVYDAALAAGRYLCAGGRDLSDPYDLERAILGYNHSRAYLHTVRAWFAHFRNGHVEVPDAAAAPGAASPSPSRRVPDGPDRPEAVRKPSASPTVAPERSAPPGDRVTPSPEPTRERSGERDVRERVRDVVSDAPDVPRVGTAAPTGGGGAGAGDLPPLSAP